jgi:O-antigen/teichoic acid export membrane protein
MSRLSETDAGARPPGDRTASSGLRADSLATGVLVLIVLTVFQRVVGLLRNVLFCRLMEPAELGRWNLALSLLLLAAPLAVLGLPGSFGRYVEHYRQRGQLRTFLRRTAAVTVLLALVATLGMLAGHRWTSWLIFKDTQQTALVLTLAFALVSVIAFNYLTELFTALRQVRLVAWLQLTMSLLFALAAVTMLHAAGTGALGVVTAYAIACAVAAAVAGWRLRATWQSIPLAPATMPQRALWGKLMPFAAWIWISELFGNLFNTADRYMIVHFAPVDATRAASMVGQYHSSRVIADLMIAMACLLSSVVLPYLSHDWEKGHRQLVSQRLNLALKLVAIVLTAGGVMMLWAAPLIFDWAFGGKYREGLVVFPLTITYCIWFGMVIIAQNYLWCAERARRASLAFVVGLVANVTLNLLLLPRWGLVGAVVATTSANAVALAVVYSLSWSLGFHLHRGTVALSVLPLSLTTSAGQAATLLLVVGWLAVRTDWIFSPEEKRQLAEAASELAKSARRQFARPRPLTAESKP